MFKAANFTGGLVPSLPDASPRVARDAPARVVRAHFGMRTWRAMRQESWKTPDFEYRKIVGVAWCSWRFSRPPTSKSRNVIENHTSWPIIGFSQGFVSQRSKVRTCPAQVGGLSKHRRALRKPSSSALPPRGTQIRSSNMFQWQCLYSLWYGYESRPWCPDGTLSHSWFMDVFSPIIR